MRHLLTYLHQGFWSWVVLLTGTGYFVVTSALDRVLPGWQESKMIALVLCGALLFLTSFKLWEDLKIKNEELEEQFNQIAIALDVRLEELWFSQPTNGTLVHKTQLGRFVLLRIENTGNISIPALGVEVTLNGQRINYSWLDLNGSQVLRAQPKAIEINQTDFETMAVAKRYPLGWTSIEDWRQDLIYLGEPQPVSSVGSVGVKEEKVMFLKSRRTADYFPEPAKLTVNFKAGNFQKRLGVALEFDEQNEPAAKIVTDG